MKQLWIILGLISSTCFYLGRVVVVGDCQELLVFQSDTNSSLSLALDGNLIDTCTTTTAQTNYQWILDMGTAYYIDHVVVYLSATEYSSQVTLLLDVATECCDVTNFYTDCYLTFQPTYRNTSLLYNCQSPSLSHARYVRLRREQKSAVQICEVQIFGCRSPATGTTNVALFKPATQLSTTYGGIASRAVDNNTDPRYGYLSCTHTNLVTNSPLWWEVNLTLTMPVATLTIYNRGDNMDYRMKNIQILIGRYNTSAGSKSPTYTTCAQRKEVFPAVQQLVCGHPLCGQLVQVFKGSVSTQEALTLCEVQVYAGTLEAGKPRTNEIVVTTTSSPVTTPGAQTNVTSSAPRPTDTESTQNAREVTTLGFTSSGSTTSQLPILQLNEDDVSTPGSTRNDTGLSELESAVQLTSPQPSTGGSTTSPATDATNASREDDLEPTPGDVDANAAVQQPFTDAAAQEAALSSDGETLTLLGDFDSSIEFSEITGTEVSVNLDATETRIHSILPSLRSATEVTTLDSPSCQNRTFTDTALVVSGAHFLETAGIGVPVTIETDATRLLSAVTASTEAPLASIETSSTVPAMHLETLAIISTTRDVTATGLDSLAGTSVLTLDVHVQVTYQEPITFAPVTSDAEDKSPGSFTIGLLPTRDAHPTQLESFPSVSEPQASLLVTYGESLIRIPPVRSEETEAKGESFTNKPSVTSDVTKSELLISMSSVTGTKDESLTRMSALTSDITETKSDAFVTSLQYLITESELSSDTSAASLQYLTPESALSSDAFVGSPKYLATESNLTNYIYLTDHATKLTSITLVTNLKYFRTESELSSSIPVPSLEYFTTETELTNSTPVTNVEYFPAVSELASSVLLTNLDPLETESTLTSTTTAPYTNPIAVLELTTSLLETYFEPLMIAPELTEELPVANFASDVNIPAPTTVVKSLAALPDDTSLPDRELLKIVSTLTSGALGTSLDFLSIASSLTDEYLSPSFHLPADASALTTDYLSPTQDLQVFTASSVTNSFSYVTTPVHDGVAQNSTSPDITELIPVRPESDLKPVKTDFNENTLFVPLSISGIGRVSITYLPGTAKTVEVDSGLLSPLVSIVLITDPLPSHEADSAPQLFSSTLTSGTSGVAARHVSVSITTDAARANTAESAVINTMKSTSASDGWNSRLHVLMTTTVYREGTATGEAASFDQYNDSENAGSSMLTPVTLVTRFASSAFDNAFLSGFLPTPTTGGAERTSGTVPSWHQSQSAQDPRMASTLDTLSLSSSEIVPGPEVLTSSRGLLPASTIRSTPALGATRAPSSFRMCPCSCQQNKSPQVPAGEEGSSEYLSQLRSAIQDELKVEREELAKQVQKKISLPDRRTSAVVFGMVVTMATTALVALLVVGADVIRFITWLRGRRCPQRYAP